MDTTSVNNNNIGELKIKWCFHQKQRQVRS
jgi:hypothetical protein